MPIRSGAMQRPSGCRYGNMLRQRYDEVGLPCSNTMGSPSPISAYAISLPRTCRRFFWNGNAAEIMFASPVVDDYQAPPRTHYQSIMPASGHSRHSGYPGVSASLPKATEVLRCHEAPLLTPVVILKSSPIT